MDAHPEAQHRDELAIVDVGDGISIVCVSDSVPELSSSDDDDVCGRFDPGDDDATFFSIWARCAAIRSRSVASGSFFGESAIATGAAGDLGRGETPTTLGTKRSGAGAAQKSIVFHPESWSSLRSLGFEALPFGQPPPRRER